VDSFEGVTHALRSSEYHERNLLWAWVLEATGVRPVAIEDFSRLAFSYTLLSKRKLQWFVDKGLVEGWHDPSFPTIQGLLRRGLTVEALRELVISQGASKSNVLMDVEKLWAINKQVLDIRVPRYLVVCKQQAVLLKLRNGPAQPEARTVPRHRKNPALGTRVVTLASTLLIEHADAVTLRPGEEITLMHWGNAVVKAVHTDGSTIVSVEAELHLQGNVKDTEKKLHWLAKTDDLLDVVLVDFGPLITKEGLDKHEEIDQHYNRHLKKTIAAYGDAGLRSLNKGEQLQLERKGYFIVDQAFMGNEARPVVLIQTPDGRRVAP